VCPSMYPSLSVPVFVFASLSLPCPMSVSLCVPELDLKITLSLD
jgi:hypothetical protein